MTQLTTSVDSGLDFLAGGGSMGERIRAYSWADNSLGERPRPVRNHKVVIDGNDASETLAGRARTHGVIETEQRGRGLAVFDVALGAMEAIGKEFRVLSFEF